MSIDEIRTATELFKVPGDTLTGRPFNNGVGLVSAPIDPNCKIADTWATRTPAEIVEDIQDGLATYLNVPVRMLTCEYKTRLDAGDTAAWDNHQALIYARHSARFTAAVDKVRKAKNHGPRGKWGKLK
jgi:hypothetical protein